MLAGRGDSRLWERGTLSVRQFGKTLHLYPRLAPKSTARFSPPSLTPQTCFKIFKERNLNVIWENISSCMRVQSWESNGVSAIRLKITKCSSIWQNDIPPAPPVYCVKRNPIKGQYQPDVSWNLHNRAAVIHTQASCTVSVCVCKCRQAESRVLVNVSLLFQVPWWMSDRRLTCLCPQDAIRTWLTSPEKQAALRRLCTSHKCSFFVMHTCDTVSTDQMWISYWLCLVCVCVIVSNTRKMSIFSESAPGFVVVFLRHFFLKRLRLSLIN